MEFTAHNILLNDGSRTLGANEPLLSDGEQCKAILRTINQHFPEKDRSAIRVVDLGCLEGGYTVAFARAGYQALGIEARETNVAKCRQVADQLNLPNLKFVQDDVKNLADHGSFDVVFCCGLLYHLDNPQEFLDLVGTLTERMLIVHTHYAREHDPLYDNKLYQLKNKIQGKIADASSNRVDYGLSKLATHEGNQGRWFYEYSEEDERAFVEKELWRSYSNTRSFWPCKKDLLQIMRTSGFELVYEQYDFLDNIKHSDYIDRHDRSLFVGIKQYQ